MSDIDYNAFMPDGVTSASFTVTFERLIGYTGGTVTIAEDGISRITNDETGMQYFTTPWNVSYKDILRGKIIDRFWKREIGLESIEMFQQAMRTKLNEIMPYMNQLYASTKIEFDPLSTINIHTVASNDIATTQTSHGTNVSDTDGTTKSRSVASSTPQTMLSGNKDYATGASDTNSDANTTSNVTEDANQDGTTNAAGDTLVTGYNGAASDLLMRYRASILNIDVMVLDQLEELFMGVWDTGDSYFPQSRGWGLTGYQFGMFY